MHEKCNISAHACTVLYTYTLLNRMLEYVKNHNVAERTSSFEQCWHGLKKENFYVCLTSHAVVCTGSCTQCKSTIRINIAHLFHYTPRLSEALFCVAPFLQVIARFHAAQSITHFSSWSNFYLCAINFRLPYESVNEPLVSSNNIWRRFRTDISACTARLLAVGWTPLSWNVARYVHVC